MDQLVAVVNLTEKPFQLVGSGYSVQVLPGSCAVMFSSVLTHAHRQAAGLHGCAVLPVVNHVGLLPPTQRYGDAVSSLPLGGEGVQQVPQSAYQKHVGASYEPESPVVVPSVELLLGRAQAEASITSEEEIKNVGDGVVKARERGIL